MVTHAAFTPAARPRRDHNARARCRTRPPRGNHFHCVSTGIDRERRRACDILATKTIYMSGYVTFLKLDMLTAQ